MSQPQWVTTAGHLGTIPEGVFYQVQLSAIDPAHPLDPTAVTYRVIAGNLPLGIECTSTGVLKGIPYSINGLENINSKFAIRASTNTIPPRFSDRTFDFTVLAQVAPTFITPAGNVGTFYDGGPNITPIQIQISDPNPGDNVVISLAAGTLPSGLSLSKTGLITGYIMPLVPINQDPGFDVTPFDKYAFDFAVNSLSTNYQFTLEVNDGRETNLRTFEIYVYSRSSLTADTTEFTVDNTFITADETNVYSPFLVNAVAASQSIPLTADNTLFKADDTFITADQTVIYAPFAAGYVNNLGTARSDNFWAYQFIGLDFDEDIIEYLEYSGAGLQLPPGTTLDLQTGWLYGYLPNLGAVQNTYNFAVYVRKAYNPQYRSAPYYFSLSLTGQVNTDTIWVTAANLGTIVNGSTSTLYVEAVNVVGGRSLQYSLNPGSYPSPNIGVYNKLPQGLELLSSGEIAGRVSFNTFAQDLGTTTFDHGTTTFDSTYTFTVNATSTDGQVSVYKTFTIKVLREYNEPYENLYIKCMPPQSNRDLINQLIQNQDIIPTNLVYRADDPNFGVAKNVIYQHAYGLTASTYEEYVSSLNINHYWKNLVLGSIKTARALDDTGNVIYEVVYSSIVDDLVNAQGQSVSKSVTLPYTVTLADDTQVYTVYPNSLINMRDQVIDTVGQISKLLPRWMLSKQANGKVLGFTPAWVIAYCKPGKSGQVAYNIAQQYGEKLNLVDFEVDRYELDRLLSKNWDPVADSTHGAWVPTPAATTFDLSLHYEVSAIGNYYVSPYAIGDEILILGSQIGGQNGVNDTTIKVQSINTAGGINGVAVQGLAPFGTSGDVFSSVAGTNIIGTGSGGIFDILVGSGVATTFDAGSMVFEAPVDMYSNTDTYDRYLVFPRRTILSPVT